MKKACKGVVWVCILSMLLMGCYTSELIEPKSSDWEKVPWGKVECVVTKDGTKYDCDVPPIVDGDAIVGELAGKSDGVQLVEIALPVSEVAQCGGRLSGEITYVIMKTGAKYTFEKPPTFIDKSIVGKIKVPMEYGDADTRIQIPLANVAYVSLRSLKNSEMQALVGIAVVIVATWGAMSLAFQHLRI